MSNQLIRIAIFYNQFDAELAKFKLEENNIYCFIKNENIAQLQFGIADFELMVREDDKDLAIHCLNESDNESDENADKLHGE